MAGLSEELTSERIHILIAWGDFGLGAYYLMADDPSQAQTHLEACLAYSRAENRILVVTDTLCKLGYAAQMQGERCGQLLFYEP